VSYHCPGEGKECYLVLVVGKKGAESFIFLFLTLLLFSGGARSMEIDVCGDGKYQDRCLDNLTNMDYSYLQGWILRCKLSYLIILSSPSIPGIIYDISSIIPNDGKDSMGLSMIDLEPGSTCPPIIEDLRNPYHIILRT
jgi:hypothetical protein